MDLQVLVAAMGQTDLQLYDRMNLRQNTVIANQCGRWDCTRKETADGSLIMLSSDTKGVGINRNLALQLAEGEILLFADDDISYYDGSLQGVKDAFRQLPDADMIIFGMDKSKNGERIPCPETSTKRVFLWNSLRYGTYRIAIRRSAVERGRLSFSTLFGGGSLYGSGEDTIFIRDCFRAGLRVYTHSYVLGVTAKDCSTWFTGYNEKFMFDKGAFIACAFPGTKHLIKWHFIRRFKPQSDMSLSQMLYWMNKGIKAFPALESYEDTLRKQNGETLNENRI